MSSTETSVQEIIEKIRKLPSAELSELDTFVDFLRFKAQHAATSEAGASLHLIHLRGLLSGYDTSPETLAELRRELWGSMQQ